MTQQQRALLSRQLAAVACLLTLAACHPRETKQAGQALASVNGTDITVHQVNAELGNAQLAAGANAPELQKRALEQVIDRELLAAKAVEAKLDRDPAVMLAIERNKSQVLAQAYLQSRLGAAARPSKTEIAAYIEKHPELFSQRKVYDLRYLAMPAAAMTDEVAGLVEQAKSLDDLAAALHAHNVAFTESRGYRSSADLPGPLLANLDTVMKRPVFTMRDNNQALLASLTYVKDDPVPAAQAEQQVAQYLARTKAATVAQEEVARLRSQAKIDYAKGSEPASAQPAAPSAAEKTASADTRSAIESGAAGLR